MLKFLFVTYLYLFVSTAFAAPDDLRQTASPVACGKILESPLVEFSVGGVTHTLTQTVDSFDPNETDVFFKYTRVLDPLKKPRRNEQPDGTRIEAEAVPYREIGVDSAGAIDARPKSARKFLENYILSRSEAQNSTGVFVFIDVNDLGKINYFYDQFAAGDIYLNSISQQIKKHLREGDLFFRLGGDEYVVVIPSIEKKLIQKRLQKLSDAVLRASDARRLIQREVMLFEQNEHHKVASEDHMAWLRRLRPSVSIGSQIIGTDATLDSLVTATSTQAGEVKMRFKSLRGDSLEKYDAEQLDELDIDPNAHPIVSPPLEP